MTSADPATAAVDVRHMVLRKRHAIRRAIRAYLDAQGLIEVDAPLLVSGTTPDAHLESFAVDDRYLVVSTEYQIKRLAGEGLGQVYTLTQNFRKGDCGALHNPEFTMLEWARAGASMADLRRDAEHVVCLAWQAANPGELRLCYQGRAIDLTPPWPVMTVREAIAELTGLAIAGFTAEDLAAVAAAVGIAVPRAWRSDEEALFALVSEWVQARLGFESPVFLTQWPAFQSASTVADGSGEVAERHELVIAGIEIADGFPTLTDPTLQRRAVAAQQRRRAALGRAQVRVDERYLAALGAGIPAGAGMALGFDRLVMLLTDRPSLAQVLTFAWDAV